MVAPLNIPSRPAPPLMVRLPNWVGDVVMCLPALKHLSNLGMPMVICGRAWAKPLIQNIQFVEFVILTGSFWHDLGAVRKAVKPNGVGLTFPDSLSSALIFRFAGVPTLGYRDDGRSWLLKWPVDKLKKPEHAVEKWFYLADVGVRTWRSLSEIKTLIPEKHQIQGLFATENMQHLQAVKSVRDKQDIEDNQDEKSLKNTLNNQNVETKDTFLTNEGSHDYDALYLNRNNLSRCVDLPTTIYIALKTTQITHAAKCLKQAQIANQPYILIAPTATGQHRGKVKIWPYFAELTRVLQQQGFNVVACPPQHERAQALEQAPTVTLLDPTDLGTFAALTQAAELVICNDSGVSHIAAAVGANQITLFGVTDPKHTGPWSDVALCLGRLGQWPDLEDVLQAVNSKLTSPFPLRGA
jgi:ADP-heptose:LPS heptosyltransferase